MTIDKRHKCGYNLVIRHYSGSHANKDAGLYEEANYKTILRSQDRGGRTGKLFLKRIRQDNKGFTLIELLIVIAVIAVLSAVVLPNVTGLIGHGEAEGAKAELVTIQTAMDTMMAKEGLSSVTATSATNAMSAFPTGNPLYPNYLRTATSTGTYSCDSTGLVTQVTTGYE